MEDYVVLARGVLALCDASTPKERACTVRALTTALASVLTRVQEPGLLLALITRDLSEAALQPHQYSRSAPAPQAKRRRAPADKNVVYLAAVRQRRGTPHHIPDGEPA